MDLLLRLRSQPHGLTDYFISFCPSFQFPKPMWDYYLGLQDHILVSNPLHLNGLTAKIYQSMSWLPIQYT